MKNSNSSAPWWRCSHSNAYTLLLSNNAQNLSTLHPELIIHSIATCPINNYSIDIVGLVDFERDNQIYVKAPDYKLPHLGAL